MAHLFLSSDEQGIVVFKIWQSLGYGKRILLSACLIIAGFAIQYMLCGVLPGVFYSALAGVLPILAGSLLLLVSGYDNRTKIGRYDPSAEWVRTDKSKLVKLKQFDKKMRTWDRSAIDLTNPIGGFMMVVLLVGIALVFMAGFYRADVTFTTISIDAAVLLFPHWVTGVRGILRKPKLLLKTKVISGLLSRMEDRIGKHRVEFFMLLKGKDVQIPDDIKFRLAIEGQSPDFLGFYGQVVTNTVQGHDYPYFYVVLVAKKGYGLDDVYRKYSPPEKLTKEFSREKDVEVFVIRQTTTKKSGYHTKDWQIDAIFTEGLELAEKAAGEPVDIRET